MKETLASTTQEVTTSYSTADVVAAFLDDLDRAPKTVATYERALRQFVAWLDDEGKAIHAVTAADLLAYKQHVSKGRKAATVNSYLTAVRCLFSWIEIKTGYRNPAKAIEGVRGSHKARASKSHDALTVEQAKAVISHKGSGLAGLRDRAMINVMLRCALRTVEVSRANIGDLRMMGSKQTLAVRGKGHAEADTFVVLDADAMAPLNAYLMARRAAGETLTDETPLFASIGNRNQGGRMSTRSISRVVKDTMKAEGMDSPRLSAHSLRHSAITFAVEGGATLLEAQSFARHEDARTTQIYIHTNDRLKAVGEGYVAAILAVA